MNSLNEQKRIKAKIKFISLVEETPGYSIFGELKYININTKIELLHEKCNNVFSITPKNFKYGKRCPNKNCVQERKVETCLQKYGTRHQTHSAVVKSKTRITNLKKYGSVNPMQNDEVKNKFCNTMFERYGASYTSQSSFLKEKYRKTTFGQRIENLQLSKNITLLNKDLPLEENINKQRGIFKCNTCQNVFERSLNSSSQKTDSIECRICFSLENISKSEKELQSFVSSLIKTENNKRFYEEGRYIYELDVFIPSKNLGIEFDGVYWHSENAGGKNKNYHIDKLKYFNSKGINVIFIRENEWNNKKNIVKSIILNRIGISKNNIYARKCFVEEVGHDLAREFLNNNHIQGYTNSSINIGLFYNGELVSILTLGKSRYSKKHEYEIYRFCNLIRYNVVGGFQKLLKFFIKKYNPKSIITYSDRRFFTGKVYEIAGFVKEKDTKPNYMYIDCSYQNFYSRVNFQKHKLINILGKFDKNLTEFDNMKLNGFDRIWDCGNFVYTFK